MFKKMFVLSAFIFVGLHDSTYAHNAQVRVHDVDFVQVKKILEEAQDKNLTVQEVQFLLQKLLVHEQSESFTGVLPCVCGVLFAVGLGMVLYCAMHLLKDKWQGNRLGTGLHQVFDTIPRDESLLPSSSTNVNVDVKV